MSEAPRDEHPHPTESPFQTPPVEGIPYSRGSDEERAIDRILEAAERDRTKDSP